LSRRIVVGAATTAIAIGGGVFIPGPAARAANVTTRPGPTGYEVNDLVSDQKDHAKIEDDDLVNAFGLSSSPTSAIWVSDNHTGLATTYSGAIAGSPVTKDMTTVQIPDGSPTGQVFNSTSDFDLSADHTNPAIFIFATEGGHISAWNPHVDPTHAVNKAGDSQAIYKGLTLASTAQGSRLYASNFSDGRVDVFDGSFMPVSLAPDAFTDSAVPHGFAPFNVQAIGDRIFVSFAKQDAEKTDEVDGRGLGYVDAFTTDGVLVRRMLPHKVFNAPWGMVMAPHDFGRFGDALLVGNFGDGRIHAFDPQTGALLGSLRDGNGHGIKIENLWGLRVGNSNFAGEDAIVFSAGPGDEAHGLLGTLTPRA
jgi:uncharacterized protein (TIGR03118 family)